MAKRNFPALSKAQLTIARRLLKQQRTKPLPTQEDLAELEKQARREMERVKQEYGVG
jgi:hypothetical protein